MTKTEELAAIQWFSWTGVLGNEVQGVWPKYSQVNDINATDADFQHNVIVTGDDFGLVKLFRFPTMRKGKLKRMLGSEILCRLLSLLVYVPKYRRLEYFHLLISRYFIFVIWLF